MSQSDIASPGRRRFLGVLAAGGTAAAGVAVAGVPLGTEPESGPSAGPKTAAATETAGYRETDHIRRYYALARG